MGEEEKVFTGINRPYQESGYSIRDSASWDTNAGKEQANMDEESSQSHPQMLSDGTEGSYDTGMQLLISPGNETHVMNENSTIADSPLDAGLEMERATMEEARGKTFGGKLEEENNKCRALNKLGNHGKDYTDQNGSKKKPIGCRT